jgi:hypothetical protein
MHFGTQAAMQFKSHRQACCPKRNVLSDRILGTTFYSFFQQVREPFQSLD